jgi:ABC-type Fe3+ transport system permease subunit
MVVEAVVGFLTGAAIAIIPRTPKGRRHAFGFALVGALLGIALSWILARVFHIVLFDWRDASELVSCMALQAAGAIAGISYVVSREQPPQELIDELPA